MRYAGFCTVLLALVAVGALTPIAQAQNSNPGSAEEVFDPYETLVDIPQTIGVTLLRRIGSAEELGYMFAHIGGLVVDKENNLHVLDLLAKELTIYGSDGILLDQYEFVEGWGPGEFLRPATFAMSEDDQRYYIFDNSRFNITILDREFTFLKSFPVSVYQHAFVEAFGEDKLLVTPEQMTMSADSSLIRLVDEEGIRRGDYLRRNEVRPDMAVHAPGGYLDSQGDRIFLSRSYPPDLSFYTLENGDLTQYARRYQHLGSEDDYSDDVIRLLRPQTGQPYETIRFTASTVCANDRFVVQTLHDWKSNRTILDVYRHSGEHVGTVDLTRELGLKSTTVCFSNALGNDNVVYLPIRGNEYPEIYAVKLDLE